MRHAGNDQQGRNVVKPYDRAFIACIYRMWHLYSHRTKHTHQVGPGLVRRRLTDALMCGDQIRSTAGFRVSKEVLVDQKGPSLPANSAEAGSFAYSSLTCNVADRMFNRTSKKPPGNTSTNYLYRRSPHTCVFKPLV